jgi:hypothetical protein
MTLKTSPPSRRTTLRQPCYWFRRTMVMLLPFVVLLTSCARQYREGCLELLPQEVMYMTDDIDPVLFATLRAGMTKKELITAVGVPSGGFAEQLDPMYTHAEAVYGKLQFDHPAFPQPFFFRVSIRLADSTVTGIDQPFCLPVSRIEMPAPQLLTPAHLAKAADSQLFVDYRWKPCYAPTSVEYDIEIWVFSIRQRWDEMSQWDENATKGAFLWKTVTTKVPYQASVLPGANDIIWRVRARTANYEGPWSDFSAFSAWR